MSEPILKWAGKKSWLVDLRLRKLWEDYRILRPSAELVEPFVGSLAVALGLRPKNATLNDINPHLINLYRWTQDTALHYQPEDEQILINSPAAFIENRERFNTLAASPEGRHSREAALLFAYLNLTCFNGLCRFNASGQFNVGYGKYKFGSERYTKFFIRAAALKPVIQHWDLTCGDFADVPVKPGSFVYCDPPYDDGFTGYAGGFSWKDQVRLVEWLDGLDGQVVLSNKATDRICKLYRSHDYMLEFCAAPRSISCNGDRTPVKEVIAYRHV